MYDPLADKSDAAVRKNTLMVLTHLILNDMMKARAGGACWEALWVLGGCGCGTSMCRG